VPHPWRSDSHEVNRIPLRNSTTLAYICQLILASHTGLRYELNLRSGEAGGRFIVDAAVEMLYGKPPNRKEKTKENTDEAGAESADQ